MICVMRNIYLYQCVYNYHLFYHKLLVWIEYLQELLFGDFQIYVLHEFAAKSVSCMKKG